MVFREESGGNNERIGQYRFELGNTSFGQIDLEPIANYISLSSKFLPQLHRRHWQDHYCEVLCWHQWFQVINGTEPPTQIVFKTQIRKKKYDENFFE